MHSRGLPLDKVRVELDLLELRLTLDVADYDQSLREEHGARTFAPQAFVRAQVLDDRIEHTRAVYR